MLQMAALQDDTTYALGWAYLQAACNKVEGSYEA
jgi:hypothetical protein